MFSSTVSDKVKVFFNFPTVSNFIYFFVAVGFFLLQKIIISAFENTQSTPNVAYKASEMSAS